MAGVNLSSTMPFSWVEFTRLGRALILQIMIRSQCGMLDARYSPSQSWYFDWQPFNRFVYCIAFVIALHCSAFECLCVLVIHRGMQCSIYLCLSQARINWEGCARKGIRCKNGGNWWSWIADWSAGSGARPDCQCVCLLLSCYHYKVQKKLSSVTASPAWSQKKGRKWLWWHGVYVW